ncbi:D-glycero-beta-D-manno-heptose 1-phosphate adenylyltransferase [Candidatus Poribacteria bacterium]|nr:D-glycero-beta-D-manno-heptose 1-phosphate adenylyltransferase [Candidatus Poribacteria bacterium]
MKNKICSLQTLKKKIAKHKKEGKKVVFTNGCFDILHIGHLTYLHKASRLGDIMVVGLNSDSSVQKIKGMNRPLVPEKERAFALACLEFIDYIVIFKEENPIKVISTLIPDILVKGSDYKKKDILGGDIVINNGGKVIRIPLVKGCSTTNFIKHILERFGDR